MITSIIKLLFSNCLKEIKKMDYTQHIPTDRYVEVDADKKHMNKNIDNCEIVMADLTSPILKTVFKCYCNYRFIRDCHIFRHLRYEYPDKNISQKNVNSHIKIMKLKHLCLLDIKWMT